MSLEENTCANFEGRSPLSPSNQETFFIKRHPPPCTSLTLYIFAIIYFNAYVINHFLISVRGGKVPH